MANHASHAALPYPIKGARFTVLIPYLDDDGDPTDPTTPDTEVSKDDGAAADAAEEVSSPKNSVGMITLTGAETDCSCLGVAAKAASGPKSTLLTLFPRVLASVGTGTLSAGSAGGGTLGTLLAYDVTGCFIKTTGGTGGGGTGGANNQARKIATYNTGTGAFTVTPNWETAPDATTTYEILLPEGVTLGMLRTLNPATAGRTADLDSSGRVLLQPTQTGVTIPTVTTVTGHTPQTGDAYAVVNNGTFGNSALKTLVDILSAYVDTEVAAIKAKTDALPSDPADASDISTAFASVTSSLSAISAFIDTEVAAIKAKTDQLTFTVANKVDANAQLIEGSDATNQIGASVLDAAAASHNTAGTIGEKINAAGNAGDPWTTDLPGDYEPGTAGYIIGQNIDAQISDLANGPAPSVGVGGLDCAEVQYFDQGEIKPVGAQLVCLSGTFTITEVKVTLQDAADPPSVLYGIDEVDASDFDIGALTAPTARYELDTVDPPADGPIAVGNYQMIFKFVGVSSDTVNRTIEVPVVISVS